MHSVPFVIAFPNAYKAREIPTGTAQLSLRLKVIFELLEVFSTAGKNGNALTTLPTLHSVPFVLAFPHLHRTKKPTETAQNLRWKITFP